VRTTIFEACRQQDFAVMIDRATKAGQGLMPISKAVRAPLQTHKTALRCTRLHRFRAAAVFCPLFYPKRQHSGAERFAFRAQSRDHEAEIAALSRVEHLRPRADALHYLPDGPDIHRHGALPVSLGRSPEPSSDC
jgi:hypothetical protein